MLGSSYDNQTCSIARGLEVVGERWTLLILRDVFLGVQRFDELARHLGIARNVLTSRLDGLVEQDILERRAYQERPPRYEYHLTARGRDLWPVLHALLTWGDEHAPAAGGPPTVMTHRGCGGAVDPHRLCTRCGARLELDDVRASAGPGATASHPLIGAGAATTGG